MKRKKTAAAVLLSVFIGTAVLIVSTILRYAPSDPLDGCDQLVLVLAKTRADTGAVLQMFDRKDGSWKFSFSCPVVIGKNGMAWGRGLHRKSDIPEGDPVKREGDGATPEGAFPLLHAYGYQPQSMVNIDFPYTQSTPELVCCDDPDSEYYTKIIDTRRKGLGGGTLPSHEKMLRDDDLYKYTVLVGHNTWKPERGAGSCIFIHLWRGPDSSTAGCIAMSEEDMLTLLSELKAGSNPVAVILTRKNYLRLREPWGLPKVTI